LDACLGYLREGDTLVITRLDRLGRSMKHLKAIVDELEARKVVFRVLEQQIDTSSSGGRLFFHILAGFAEFEHDLIVERTKDGLAAARARGRKGGRKPKMTPTKIKAAQRMNRAKDVSGNPLYTVTEIAETLGVSRATIYDHLAPANTVAKAEPA
jgi:DNA invertase Pin-like site-specific DNA recombinase